MNRPTWLRCPWVSREWADILEARLERLYEERDTALAARDTAVFNRQQVLDQLAEADAANRKLHDASLTLSQQLFDAKVENNALNRRVVDAENRARKAQVSRPAAAIVSDELPPDGAPATRDETVDQELRRSRDHARALDRRLSEVTAANARCRCGGAA